MIILRQKIYSQLPLDLDTTKHSYNSEVDNMETTKQDKDYANRLMREYIKSANPNAKNFRVRDMETGEWRKGTKDDVKRILSPEAKKAAYNGYIYESKLNRLQGK